MIPARDFAMSPNMAQLGISKPVSVRHISGYPTFRRLGDFLLGFTA
jgi:hypothetical protein